MWRDFHVPNAVENYGAEGGFYRSGGIDQLKNIIYTLQKNPQDRRMICSAWNPLALNFQALPPCHVLFQVSVINNKLNLTWFQRSCDILLGIPFNIASYGLLLHLFAKFYGFEEGTLTGFLNNVHIYENQLDGFNEIMSREPNFDLPTVSTDTRYGNLLTWEYRDTTLNDYKCLPTVKMPVAI
jgi:thymidylate synthase